MSWLKPRRPKKSHPWPPRETRGAVIWELGKQETRRIHREVINRAGGRLCGKPIDGESRTCERGRMHDGECKVFYLVPLPATADEWRAQGFTYIGSGR